MSLDGQSQQEQPGCEPTSHPPFAQERLMCPGHASPPETRAMLSEVWALALRRPEQMALR
ncbi:hypothetical protein DAEQUDRAFT_770964 [Daedalea quercina L-15889]|uniref:Uncharacterized protein n=1 Tax=Daedalea quercina L-15889 TaxID=1314783 RepID=A0A165KFE6_9APHY|nr:hypothetical protein DAEQUDRAFT_770964 [Daedalea quercina L-15889]